MSMIGWTNRGLKRALQWVFPRTLLGAPPEPQNIPTTFRVALVTAAVAPTADIVTMSQLTEIAAGNGYTSGGILVNPNQTDFDTLTQDDANDRSYTRLKDIVWTASGDFPASGAGARYAVLTDINGATVGEREVWGWWDLGSVRTWTAGQFPTLTDLEIRLGSVA